MPETYYLSLMDQVLEIGKYSTARFYISFSFLCSRLIWEKFNWNCIYKFHQSPFILFTWKGKWNNIRSKTRLTLLMLRLLSSNGQGRKDFGTTSDPCHVGINWIALAGHFQISTHLLGVQLFFRFFASFCVGQISYSSERDMINFSTNWQIYHCQILYFISIVMATFILRWIKMKL